MRLVAAAFSVAAIFAGCGGPSSGGQETPTPVAPPTEIFLEAVISGTIHGLPLSRPASIAVSDRGAVYVLDSGNRRLIWFSRDLQPLRDFTGRGDLAVGYTEPRSVSVDADRSVWVSDYGGRRLVRTNDRLELTAEIDFHDDTAATPLGRPGGMTVTGFGDLWVIDDDNQRIVVLDPAGEVEQTVGDFGDPGGKLDRPARMKIGPDGHVWVCDRQNSRIVVYDNDGGLVKEVVDPAVEDPVSVSFDQARRIWILDQVSGRIHCFDPQGRHLTTVGPTVSGADRPLLEPSDLAFMPDGRLLIADTGHDRILVCRPGVAAP